MLIIENKIDIEEENKRIAKEYKEILRKSYRTLNDADKKLIRLAFDTAVDAHSSQRRKSGEAYIFHPIAVARIIADEIGMDAISIAGALLHDVVEDSDYTLEQMESLFGKTIAKIVEGLTKITKIKTTTEETSLQAENFRKILLTMKEDVRIAIIKISDRLHNMQTMDSMRPDKQEKIAAETLYIYAPIAHRLGLYNIKGELETLSLKYINPQAYCRIADKVSESKKQQENYIYNFIDSIDQFLSSEDFEYHIKGRPKTIYSIWRKMEENKISFDEIYDKFAIRIIYDCDASQEKFIAWKIYTIITNKYAPNPSRLRDWITSPKYTGYESLHITVMGPEGKWVEVQIRSQRMDDIAERGYAAHFKYKNEKQMGNFSHWISQLEEIFEGYGEGSTVDLVQDLKLDIYDEQIFVFTPQGESKSLPRNSTVLDFAFSIHTDIGFYAKSAKINEKLCPINTVLKTGNQVEIITDPKVIVTADWLNITKTSRAHSSIKNKLNKIDLRDIDFGKRMLSRKLKVLQIPDMDVVLDDIIVYFRLDDTNELFRKIRYGQINNELLKKFISVKKGTQIQKLRNRFAFKDSFRRKKETWSQKEDLDLILFDGNKHKPYYLAECCNPIQGDEIFGLNSPTPLSEKIEVHKSDCVNAIKIHSNYSYKVLKAQWKDSTIEKFVVNILLEGVDRQGILNEIVTMLSKMTNAYMKSININTEVNHFKGNIALEIYNKKSLEDVLQKMKKIKGVVKVARDG